MNTHFSSLLVENMVLVMCSVDELEEFRQRIIEQRGMIGWESLVEDTATEMADIVGAWQRISKLREIHSHIWALRELEEAVHCQSARIASVFAPRETSSSDEDATCCCNVM